MAPKPLVSVKKKFKQVVVEPLRQPAKRKVEIVVEKPQSPFLQNLLKTPVEAHELLACANFRDTGVLAKLSRHQLQQLCDEGGFVVAPYTVEGTNLPTDEVLRIARFTVAIGLYKLDINFNTLTLHQRETKYAQMTKAILDNHNTRILSAANRSSARSANKMADTTATEIATAKHEGKAAGKNKKAATPAPTKAAAKKTAAKATPVKGAKKADAGEETASSRFANDTRKIKVVNKENPHREGTGRYNAFAEMLKSKTVADYAATGNKPKYLATWVDGGFIELV